MDLLKNMLLVDAKERISAKKALNHPFFNILNSENNECAHTEKFDNFLKEEDNDFENEKLNFFFEKINNL